MVVLLKLEKTTNSAQHYDAQDFHTHERRTRQSDQREDGHWAQLGNMGTRESPLFGGPEIMDNEGHWPRP